MRKVILKMKENNKYEAIKKLVETDGNKQRVAVNLNCTIRHINRMIIGYNNCGKEEFENIKVSPSTIRSILMEEFIISPKATRHSSGAILQFA